MSECITGIQQIGIGVENATEAKIIYRDLFRMEALIFDDKSPATLMTRYTGNEVHDRHAILSMNLSGGGGFEIWQFTSRKPGLRKDTSFGDTGIFAAKIKCQDITAAHAYYRQLRGVSVSAMQGPHFWIKDTYHNYFQVVEGSEFFHSNNHICGGVAGAVIGVTHMETSAEFYKKVLGFTEIVYDKIVPAEPFFQAASEERYRVVLLRKNKNNSGAFSKLLGDAQLELVQPLHAPPSKIFQDRYWGDCGFIHLCFDVLDMDILKRKAQNLGHYFTVDSKDSYAMDSSAGRFCYLEDPDGTLIELVETHKIPIIKKLNWHLDIKNRKHNRPLPDWMIKLLGLNKIK